MRNRKFFAFLLTAAALTLAALGGSGGCGGSSHGGGNGSGGNGAKSVADIQASILGDLSAARLKNSDIAPYIEQTVSTDKWSETTEFNDWNVLFLEDASELPSGAGSSTGDYPELADILAAYDDGLVIAAVYPDAADIAKLTEVLSLQDPPVLSDDNGHLEIFAVASRDVDGAPIPFTFTIIDLDDVTENSTDGATFYPASDDTRVVRSEDVVETGSADVTPPAETRTDADFHKDRVTSLLEWIVALDNDPKSLYAASASAESVTTAAGNGQLTDLASSEGPDTLNVDSGRRKVNFPKIPKGMRVSPYWNGRKQDFWTTDRRTRLKYDVYSIHSFANNRDYFLVRANNRTNTENQFASVINENADDSAWRTSSKARLMYGFTRRLVFNHYIDQDTSNGDVEIVASAPASKADGKSSSSTMSYNFGGKVGLSVSPKGEISGSAEFNFSVGYSTTVTVSQTEYEITPRHNGDSKKRANACWEYNFAWPADGAHVGRWYTWPTRCYQELIAWPSAKSCEAQMQWIWAVRPAIWERAKDKKLLTVWVDTQWVDGLTQGNTDRDAGAYGMKRINHEANRGNIWKSFTLKRPPHIAARPASFAPVAGGKGFDKNAGNGTFVLLSESNWKVEADKDAKSWITGFTPASGSKTGATEQKVVFSYAANTTGKPRSGNIVLTNDEGDSVKIQVLQGAN